MKNERLNIVGIGGRLEKLGRLVVDMAARLRPEVKPEIRTLRATA